MPGAITRVSVTFEVDEIEGGGRYRFISGAALQRYMRPERYEELMEDLTLGCEQVLAGRSDPDRPELNVVRRSPEAGPPSRQRCCSGSRESGTADTTSKTL